jgi:DNA-binding transcriptional regulator YhcF (GntR family)
MQAAAARGGAALTITAVPQRNTLVSSVVEQLSAQIRSGVVAPGAKLPSESELCVRFHVSRTVMREALAQLKAEELVHAIQGVGLYVAQRLPGQGVLKLRASAGSELDNTREMLDFRAGLESQAARLAAERRTRADVSALNAALDGVKSAERLGREAALRRISSSTWPSLTHRGTPTSFRCRTFWWGHYTPRSPTAGRLTMPLCVPSTSRLQGGSTPQCSRRSPRGIPILRPRQCSST